jgi:hypothetical protein
MSVIIMYIWEIILWFTVTQYQEGEITMLFPKNGMCLEYAVMFWIYPIHTVSSLPSFDNVAAAAEYFSWPLWFLS